MQILVTCKVLADDQDITVNPDGSLDSSKAHMTISTYDANAIEAAAQLAECQEAQLTAITVGDASVDGSKIKKDILARGVDRLFMAADDAFKGLEAHATAQVIASLAEKAEGWDVIICGAGSADNYSQQVDAQLAEVLGVPFANGVSSIEMNGSTITVERTLEGEVEVVELQAPAVISIVPDIALPRICGMKDILSAGKKPVTMFGAEDVAVAASSVEVISTKAPAPQDRKKEIFNVADSGVEKFVSALREALK